MGSLGHARRVTRQIPHMHLYKSFLKNCRRLPGTVRAAHSKKLQKIAKVFLELSQGVGEKDHLRAWIVPSMGGGARGREVGSRRSEPGSIDAYPVRSLMFDQQRTWAER
jgi:hypothetical protein